MTAVQDEHVTPFVEDYHLLGEVPILVIAEAASNMELYLDNVVEPDETSYHHFTPISFDKIRRAAGENLEDGAIGSALIMLEDLNLYQLPVEMTAQRDPHTVYARRIPGTGALTTGVTCQPMLGHDVRAICACVAHGHKKSIQALTRFGLAEIRQWQKRGVKARREDVRRVLLGILDDYTACGRALHGIALAREKHVKEHTITAVERREWINERWIDLLEQVKALQTLRTPVVEQKIEPIDVPPAGVPKSEHELAPDRHQPILEIVEAGLTAHKEGRLCPWCQGREVAEDQDVCEDCAARRCVRCKKADAKGRRLCSDCEDDLISQSGVVEMTPKDIPEFDEAGLVGPVLPLVGKAAFDAGVTSKEDYDYVAEQINNLVATFDQYEVEMEDAGIFVRGVNLEDGPIKARHANPRMNSGLVVAAGMKFRPHMLRHLIKQLDQAIREAVGMYGEPLLDRAGDEDDRGVVVDYDARKMLRMLKSRLGLVVSIADELGAEIEEEDLGDRASGF
jgi:hypothetical protein